MTVIYTYTEYKDQTIAVFRCKVEIVKNDKKTYLVKLLSFCGDHRPGERIRVHKKSISF